MTVKKFEEIRLKDQLLLSMKISDEDKYIVYFVNGLFPNILDGVASKICSESKPSNPIF